MLEKIKNDLMQNNVFLTGGAGVGKSFLTLALIDSLKKAGKRVVVLGSTGISSVHIGGQTIHSFFMFGIS
ncbi:MAG: type IV secretion system DNA-binding domain-containing protein, partial [Campylobacterales bacterium]|nr:type IV secretion system DNA-binding domain-containing protein [Campylobacterales bacterium]